MNELRLPLRCKRCKEVLAYGFERVLLDVESKDPYGDPAFVGEIVCKACGTEGELEPTPDAGRILTSHMMEFLNAARGGRTIARPKVMPAETQLRGKRVGFADGASASSIRRSRSRRAPSVPASTEAGCGSS